MTVLGYAFLLILGAVGVMNLINTMVNSIYTRRRELGIIQAIGMSGKAAGADAAAGRAFLYGGYSFGGAGDRKPGRIRHLPVCQSRKYDEHHRVSLSGDPGGGPGRGGGGAADDPYLRRVPELPQDEPDRPDPVWGVGNRCAACRINRDI